ncbi:unnamed protein product [Urochloa humidicola]
MELDASIFPRRRSTSCYSDGGDSCSASTAATTSPSPSSRPRASMELESPSPSLNSLRRAAMELRLLAKHNPDNRIRIAAAGASGRSCGSCVASDRSCGTRTRPPA